MKQARVGETVRSVLVLAARWLKGKGVESAQLDAELLLAHALSVPRLSLYTDRDRPLVEAELEPFRALLKRRGAREPLAWLTGRRDFHGLSFEVSPDVLIPRPDTETLVEAGLAELARLGAGGRALRFADVGTGSGCVAIALLKNAPAGVPVSGTAIDASPAALVVATQNATTHGVLARLELVEGDLLGPVRGGAELDLVVSNPPYVTPEERAQLEPEVLREPALALFDTGPDLPLTARLAREAALVLAPGGALAVETGAGRSATVVEAFRAAGFTEIRVEQDLGRIERVVVGRRPAAS